MTKRMPVPCLSLLAAVLAGGCTKEQLGLPRTPVSATSPDGRFVAFVRNHPSLDPPSQSIWLGVVGGSATKLKMLGPDSDWCNTIAWSPDSSSVGFLVQDARLIAVDARAGRVVFEQWLTDWKGEYPPSRVVQDLSLSGGGREARFRDCGRASAGRGRTHEARDCGSLRTVEIRVSS